MGQQKGNPTPSYQNQAYEALRPNTNARANRDMGTKPVMIDDTKTLDELIDSGSQLFTKGYAKDTDLIDGTINARFDTLTANEYHITILSSSVLYANGSNKFGDTADDRHEFTGSILVAGDVLGNARLNQATASIQFATASLNTQTGSQGNLNAQIGIATASLNTYTGSNNSVVARILQTTASLNAFTSSQLAVNLGISTATGSINTNINSLSSSLEARISNLEQPSKAYNTSNTSYTAANGGTVTFTLISGGDTRGYSINEIVYFQKFDGSFTGIGTVTGYTSPSLSVTQNSGGAAGSGNYWVISRYSLLGYTL